MSPGRAPNASATESNPDFAAPPPPTAAPSSTYRGLGRGDGSGKNEDGDGGPITVMQRFIMNRSDSTYHAFAGAAGGFMSGIVTCPLDVIKTKLQAQGGFAVRQAELRAAQAAQAAQGQANTSLPHGAPSGAANANKAPYSGMFGTGKVILREEGVRGLYRGLGPIILGYLPTWAVWFTVYGKSKEYFTAREYSDFSANFWSSIVAGSSSTVVTNPIWVVKTRMMSQVGAKAAKSSRTPWHYRSTLDAFRTMYKTEGVLSFYSGLTPALLGLTHVAVQFPAYEYLKTQFTGHGMGMHGEDSGNQWVGVLCASVVSKIIASSATYPHEVIRTRLQTQQRQISGSSSEAYTQYSDSTEAPDKKIKVAPSTTNGNGNGMRYNGVINTAKTILKEEGWRAFYAGMGTNMMRAVPAACTTMLTYEYVMKYFTRTKERAKAHEENYIF